MMKIISKFDPLRRPFWEELGVPTPPQVWTIASFSVLKSVFLLHVAQEVPRPSQDPPKTPQDLAKTPPRPPQEGPRAPKIRPRRPQEAPRPLQDAPKGPAGTSKALDAEIAANEGSKTIPNPRRSKQGRGRRAVLPEGREIMPRRVRIPSRHAPTLRVAADLIAQQAVCRALVTV